MTLENGLNLVRKISTQGSEYFVVSPFSRGWNRVYASGKMFVGSENTTVSNILCPVLSRLNDGLMQVGNSCSVKKIVWCRWENVCSVKKIKTKWPAILYPVCEMV